LRFAIFGGITGFPSLHLGASPSAVCAADEGWLPAACKTTVLQEFAPKTAADLPSASLLKKPQRRLCMVPKIQVGQERLAGQQMLASLLRAMSASEALKVEPRPLLRVQLSHNDDGYP